ncbi:MAG: hypothetical protein ACREAR_04910 [Nitrosotalea sp.]
MLESLYNKDITNKQASEIASRAVSAARERDPGSGNGINILAIQNLQKEAVA